MAPYRIVVQRHQPSFDLNCFRLCSLAFCVSDFRFFRCLLLPLLLQLLVLGMLLLLPLLPLPLPLLPLPLPLLPLPLLLLLMIYSAIGMISGGMCARCSFFW